MVTVVEDGEITLDEGVEFSVEDHGVSLLVADNLVLLGKPQHACHDRDGVAAHYEHEGSMVSVEKI
jgi:hypothetical protein